MAEAIDKSLYAPQQKGYRYPDSKPTSTDKSSFSFDSTYIATGIIGKGGFGKVYRVKDNDGDEYALKRIAKTNRGIPCLMEASMMASYQHPRLNAAIKFQVLENELYILQNRARCNLESWRELNRPTREQVKEFIFGIADALNFIHQQGVIHGDVKASNILIFGEGDFKLGDYSLSCLKKWERKIRVGTASSRPIEGWTNNWDEQADIWALGCLSYYLIFGKQLFLFQGLLEGDEKSYAEKYLSPIEDWNRFLTTGKITRQTKNYKPPNIDARINSDDTLVQLTRSMLAIQANDRPKSSELVNHATFSGYSINLGQINRLTKLKTRGKVIHGSETIQSSEKKGRHRVIIIDKPTNLNIITPIDSSLLVGYAVSDNILEVSNQLYLRYSEYMELPEPSQLKTTLIWMAQKIVHEDRNCYEFPIKDLTANDLERVYELERDVCRKLNFMLH